MKKFSFLFFLVAMVGITLSSSTCRTPPVEDDIVLTPEDSTDPGTTDKNVAGPLKVAVRIGKIAGPFAGGAVVKLAYTFDSVNKEQYFKQGITDSTGYVIFTDLPVDGVTKKKSYFANAFYSEGGEELSSTNGNGSNGPLEIRLTKNIASNQALVVTYK
ncbi:MAG: hypothetical protein ACXWEY_12345 [Bacteroidia bacterium]